MITLMVTGFIESNSIKIISIIITTIFFIISLPLIFLIIIVFCFIGDGHSKIYDNTHYYCNNNIEAYSYVYGARDKIHYRIDKHYVILDFNDIIYISYENKNEVSYDEYEEYLDTNKCMLIGDINEFK